MISTVIITPPKLSMRDSELRRGFISGQYGPSLDMLIDANLTPRQLANCWPVLQQTAAVFSAEVPTVAEPTQNAVEDLLQWMGEALLLMFKTAGQALASRSRCRVSLSSFWHWQIPLPWWTEQDAVRIAEMWLELVAGVLLQCNEAPQPGLDKQAEHLLGRLLLLQRKELKSRNILFFIEGAAARGIQITALEAPMMYFGVSGYGQRMLSSTTAGTSHLACMMAGDKTLCSRVLAKAGLPVSKFKLIHKLEDASAAAKELGFPVVVKPVSMSQGKGVVAGIADEPSLLRAVDAVLKLAPECMIESYFFGEDYRLILFKGKVIWVYHREPAGVHGDGVHSIAELMAQVNQDPRRGSGPQYAMVPLVIDEEVRLQLTKQGLNEHSVPEQGQFVRFRLNANTSTGGTPVVVNGLAHPDNLALAEKAVAVLGLDLAGLDLLCPDISKSWLDVGAVICEVNPQPQLSWATGPHLFGDVLQQLVKRQGRAPVIAVYDSSSVFWSELTQTLAVEPLNWVVVKQNRLWQCGKPSSVCFDTAFEAMQATVIDPSIQGIIVDLSCSSLAKNGLPFHHLDELWVDDTDMLKDLTPWLPQVPTTVRCKVSAHGPEVWRQWCFDLQRRIEEQMEKNSDV